MFFIAYIFGIIAFRNPLPLLIQKFQNSSFFCFYESFSAFTSYRCSNSCRCKMK